MHTRRRAARPRLNAGADRAAQYNYYLLMPSILFSVLALLSAFLPPDSGERLGFGVTLVLAREFCKARRSYVELHATATATAHPAFPINNRRWCSSSRRSATSSCGSR